MIYHFPLTLPIRPTPAVLFLVNEKLKNKIWTKNVISTSNGVNSIGTDIIPSFQYVQCHQIVNVYHTDLFQRLSRIRFLFDIAFDCLTQQQSISLWQYQ